MSNNSRLKTLKILVMTHYYPEHRGGVEIVAGKLAEYLTREGQIEIKWMASDIDLHPVGVTKLQCLPIKSSNFIEKKIQIAYPLWSLSFLGQLWKAIQWSDVIHIHDYIYMGNLTAFLFARISGKPVLITQHIGFILYNSPLLRLFLSLLNRTLGKWVFQGVNQAVFCSTVIQQYWVSEKTRFRRPPVMIANGVDTSVFFPVEEQQRKTIRQDLGWPVEKPAFLFVGRFVEKKGLHILRQLAVRFDSVHWVFVGWGAIDPESWELPNVTVFRDRRGSTLTPLYQAADLLVLPSKGEAFPLVIQEAMACGTPAMVSSESANQYSAAKHLMFSEEVEAADTVERWTSKIEELLQNPSALAAIRPQVAEFARQHWCWQSCAEKYFQIFQELTNSSR
ncbi:glycosyltransferase family 4 protein [Microseira wollei]|uniref:Glycosyl transferase group 1 n=1 Tax=Microseira wollei NIES-4236 TaxID=2530354 RepID=A0AAV3X9Y3_9CYAN|nr:glycosyltransferase family 4 protein [Microseira wollei]GET37515.1 glycosyl transferase group 1 [Microseira wollei NIES-4236]